MTGLDNKKTPLCDFMLIHLVVEQEVHLGPLVLHTAFLVPFGNSEGRVNISVHLARQHLIMQVLQFVDTEIYSMLVLYRDQESLRTQVLVLILLLYRD